ncbi:hypothetical protein CC86DRAFT_386190 [Ophiobolus disseminans]|uniref:Uncharacterized protein n=1 Tax=Ophiobolus disseminans TaxID=1469910 RepID=A0A6A6ZL69_9PLEO|nr:hypothetical protein CC86DRAFT_386190 [Ophiobolus disseminans]
MDEGGPMQRTAPWRDASQPKPLSPNAEYVYHPLSEVFHDPSKAVTGNFDRLSLTNKVKEKTRGNASHISTPTTAQSLGKSRRVDKTLYHVDKDSLAVFRLLFYVPNDGELPRNLQWAEVVGALTKLGFSAEKLHGSAWQFAPTKLKLSRGIQFHEPHPGGEVPLWLARRHGRRLTRAYGWDGSMFRRK